MKIGWKNFFTKLKVKDYNMTKIEIKLSNRYKNKLGIGPTAKKYFRKSMIMTK